MSVRQWSDFLVALPVPLQSPSKGQKRMKGIKSSKRFDDRKKITEPRALLSFRLANERHNERGMAGSTIRRPVG
jgi:hypothetical protein